MRARRRRALLYEFMHVVYILLVCWIDDIEASYEASLVQTSTYVQLLGKCFALHS